MYRLLWCHCRVPKEVTVSSRKRSNLSGWTCNGHTAMAVATSTRLWYCFRRVSTLSWVALLSCRSRGYGFVGSHILGELAVHDNGLNLYEMDRDVWTKVAEVNRLVNRTPLVVTSLSAWHKEGTFYLGKNTRPDTSESNYAIFSCLGLSELCKKGALCYWQGGGTSGTTLSKINFGPVLKEQFTICSMTC